MIQITNLLLPDFAIHSLGGGSDLFGMLEMTAAIAGMAALALAGIPALRQETGPSNRRGSCRGRGLIGCAVFCDQPADGDRALCYSWNAVKPVTGRGQRTSFDRCGFGPDWARPGLHDPADGRARCADLPPSDPISKRN